MDYDFSRLILGKSLPTPYDSLRQKAQSRAQCIEQSNNLFFGNWSGGTGLYIYDELETVTTETQRVVSWYTTLLSYQ